MVETVRQLARAWRLDPADRARIERLIAVRGLQDCFRWEDGRLLARISVQDRARITASGGGAYRPAADRRFGAFPPEAVVLAGIGLARAATLDGEAITPAEADAHRDLARRAA